jgi:serine/threonine-protein kinase Chk1
LEARKDGEFYYLVIEWALGGELFEKIEPDVGFPEDVAHMYFVQLLSVLVLLGLTSDDTKFWHRNICESKE